MLLSLEKSLMLGKTEGRRRGYGIEISSQHRLKSMIISVKVRVGPVPHPTHMPDENN